MNQRILLAALQNARPPYSKAELVSIAEAVNRKEEVVKEARQNHYLALHDRHIEKLVASESGDSIASGRSLTRLDARTFHSVIRIVAEGQVLFPAIEEEILRRLEARQLYAHDLFTLLFRFNTSGPAWERVRKAALQKLANTPEHAVSILLMGQHTLGWSVPTFEFSDSLKAHPSGFLARVSVSIADQMYVSAWQQAPQKSQAKQLASVEVLARIAGKESEVFSAGTGGESPESSASNDLRSLVDVATQVVSKNPTLPNYKGQLVELVQALRWDLPAYVERGRSGPPHAPLFSVEGMVSGDGRHYSTQGEGTTKAQAEQHAARQLLQLIPQLPVKPPIPVAPAEKPTARSSLHEMQQKGRIRTISYTYEHAGQEHEGMFTCTCTVVDVASQSLTATGQGTTKRQAAQEASLEMLKRFSGGDMGLDEA